MASKDRGGRLSMALVVAAWIAAAAACGQDVADRSTGSAGARTYHVSGSGNDSSSGSASEPWRTLGKAASSVSSGDTVRVAAGTYAERVSITSSGVTFQADGTVDMEGFVVRADGVTVRGFDIEADGCGLSTDGVFIEASNVLVEDNTVFNTCRGGIRIHNGSNNTVRNNRLHRNGGVGISVTGNNHTITDNEVWETLQEHPKWGSNVPGWADADGMHFFGSGHVFRDNHIHDISYSRPENVDPHIDCFQTWGGASDVLFEGNRCEIPTYQQSGQSGTAFMLAQASDIRIRRNVLHAFNFINTGGGGVSNVEFVNNVVIGDPSLNNTEAGTALAIGSESNSVARNNLAIDIYIRWAPQSHSWALDHNAVWREDGSRPIGDPGPGTLWGIDPQVNGSYVPGSGSPLIDAGTNVGLPYSGSAPDIGRVEAPRSGSSGSSGSEQGRPG